MTTQEHFDSLCSVFFIGLILGLITMCAALITINEDFHKMVERIDAAREACAAANSKPFQWDMWDEVVCTNGAVMDYDSYRESSQ